MNIVEVISPATNPSALPRRGTARRIAAVTGALVLAATIISAPGVEAAIVPTINLATAAEYSVLAGSAVTNTGNSVLGLSNGVSPGSAISGFPPGLTLGDTHAADAAAAQAQADLTNAYVDAAGRSIDATTTADLGNLTLIGGVYAGPSKGALQLTGPLVLDGQNNPDSVFIFQTDSSLTTASSSTVSLINGAQECNVFWQIGSDATLGTNSTFRGNILALGAITVTTSTTVAGRALARNAAVTLDTNTFTAPLCEGVTAPTTTTTTTTGGDVTTTTDDTGAVTTVTVPGDTVPVSTTPGGTVPEVTLPATSFPVAVTLPNTGLPTRGATELAAVLLLGGLAAAALARRGHLRA